MKRILFLFGFLFFVLGCAGESKKSTVKKKATADAFLRAIVEETDGYCNMAVLTHNCVIKMFPPDEQGNVFVMVAAQREWDSANGGHAADGEIDASIHFVWNV